MWKNGRTRNPLYDLEEVEASNAKKIYGCRGCKRRAKLIGGTGECKHMTIKHGCGFVLDERKRSI